ncbi:MAG: DUF1538 domain-containing protein [Burkholderiaceae bacterium]|jgi:hypothetical protein
MPRSIRYGDYVQAITVDSEQVSYSKLMTQPLFDQHGNEVPQKPEKMRLGGMDAYKLLQPYLSVRFMEQAKAVVPLAAYLALFQLLVLNQSIQDSATLGLGLLAVMVGLMIFLEGLKLGLMPFGEIIGNKLPLKLPLVGVLFIAFLLGIGVTFAEPAIGALQVAGQIVDPKNAPYLYTLLNDRVDATVLVVGVGVGIAAVIGTMRFLYNWSLKPLIYLSLIPTALLTAYCFYNPDLRTMIGLAWDCGAVTTGPVTVPLVLALGIGVATAGGKGDSKLQGFGIVTLASLFPIMGVCGLAIYFQMTVPVETILAEAAAKQASIAAAASAGAADWWTVSPGAEIVGGIRAIVPLVIFLVIVLFFVLREKLPNAFIIFYGIFLSVLGMCIFSVGLTYGLSKLGDGAGGLVPGLFTAIETMPNAPLYSAGVGIFIAALFAWILGFGATLAEPALNALGLTVQNLTNGSFKKSMLMYSVSFGVAIGIMLGVIKLIFDFSLLWILIPGYTLGVILTYLSTEEFVNVGWDSAGVTTGPVTVPLVLAMGLGFGKAVGAVEGFGILAAASICPIVAVLALGVFVQWKTKRENAQALQEAKEEEQIAASVARASQV